MLLRGDLPAGSVVRDSLPSTASFPPVPAAVYGCSQLFAVAAPPAGEANRGLNYCSTPSDTEMSFIGVVKNVFQGAQDTAVVGVAHSRALKTGLAWDVLVGTRLMSLYTKDGCLESAHKLFNEMPQRNTITWTVVITGFSSMRFYSRALGLFGQMLVDGVSPNHITLSSVFRCLAGVQDLKGGKGVHGWLLKSIAGWDVILENSIIDLYAKCGELEYARRVFDSIAEKDAGTWNVMIGAYLGTGDVRGASELFDKSPSKDVVSWNMVISGQMQRGFCWMALEFLHKMVRFGPRFSPFTFSIALKLMGTLCLPELGRQIHCKLLRSEVSFDEFIRTSLVDMYCKCGNMRSAFVALSQVPSSSEEVQNLLNDGGKGGAISWSSMVAGYIHNGRHEEALCLVRTMFREGFVLDLFTLTSVISACTFAGIMVQGKLFHACVEKLGYGSDICLSSALIDMYAKCGNLRDAQLVFAKAEERNIILWTSMIGACASHGRGREAIETFELMLESKIMPNEVTFVGLLSACSHAGFVEEGFKYFRLMKEDFGLAPGPEHFTCMVDLLGRAGLLHKARDFIYENHVTKLGAAWKALLSGCRFHRDVDMATYATKHLVKLKPKDSGSLILLSGIFSTRRQWVEASRFRSMLLDTGVRKQPGMSWMQLENRVHTFVSGDRSHPQISGIHAYLSGLTTRLKEMGNQSDANVALHDAEIEER